MEKKVRKVASKGTRQSSRATGSLPSIIDTKRLRAIKPNSYMVHEYEKAERKRAHILEHSGPTRTIKVKGKNGKVDFMTAPIATTTELVFH